MSVWIFLGVAVFVVLAYLVVMRAFFQRSREWYVGHRGTRREEAGRTARPRDLLAARAKVLVAPDLTRVPRQPCHAFVDCRLHEYRYCAIAHLEPNPYDGLQLPPV